MLVSAKQLAANTPWCSRVLRVGQAIPAQGASAAQWFLRGQKESGGIEGQFGTSRCEVNKGRTAQTPSGSDSKALVRGAPNDTPYHDWDFRAGQFGD